MDPETRDALERLERGLREAIQASTAATHGLVADMRGLLESQIADTRGLLEAQIADTRGLLEAQIAQTRRELEGQIAELRGEVVETRRETADLRTHIAASEERTRRHFDVVAESLRADIRALADGIMAVADGSSRRDAELGGRVDRLENRVLGLESRVSVLEQPPPTPRRRR